MRRLLLLLWLASALPQEKVEGLEIKATVSAGIDRLFRLLGRLGPGALMNATVLITRSEALPCKPEPRGLRLSGPALIVPLEPFVTKIQNQMMPPAMGPASATRPLAQKLRRRA